MANVKAIDARIKSVQSTEQITKAMKMVAASKLRKVQSLLGPMRSFRDACANVLDTLLIDDGSLDNVFARKRNPVKKVCYVLFVGNRGLCGVYNTTILKYMQEIAAKETRDYVVVVCGRWGRDVIEHSGMKIGRFFSEFSDAPSATEALDLTYYLRELYASGEVDEVQLVYMSFVSALGQEPVTKQLLPVKVQSEARKGMQGVQSILFVPDKADVFDSVISLCLNNRLYYTMLEAKCGEHSSRMIAMTAASDSTKELIAQLQLELNRARQSAITTEINEIVGGAAALKKKQ